MALIHTLYMLRGYGYPVGGGGSQPAVPDPNATIAAQNANNKQTTAYNNAITHGNTTSPLGSQTYTSRVDPVTGATVYDQSIALDPAQQGLQTQENTQNATLGNTATGLTGQVASSYANPLDTSGLPKVYGADDLLGARQQVQDALYKQQASYLDPQYQQGDQAMRTRLANQGIVEGSDAWNNAIDAFNRDKQANYSTARNSAITMGDDELSRLANLSTAQRQQALSEALTTRNEPLTELNNIRSTQGNSAVNMPTFASAQNSTVPNSDLANAIMQAFGANNSQYNQNQTNKNSVLSGLFGLGNSAINSGALGGIWDKLKGLFGVGAQDPATTAAETGAQTTATANPSLGPTIAGLTPSIALGNPGALPPVDATVAPEYGGPGQLAPPDQTSYGNDAVQPAEQPSFSNFAPAAAAPAVAAGIHGLLGLGVPSSVTTAAVGDSLAPYIASQTAAAAPAAAATGLGTLAAADTLAPITSLTSAPAYTGAAAASSASSSVAAALPWVAGAAAIAAVIANNTKSHVDGIGALLPGQNVEPIPGSPQSAAVDGSLALGAGNDRSEGSGQFYIKNPQTGALTWTGTNGSTLLGKLFAKNFQGWTPEQTNAYTQFLASLPPNAGISGSVSGRGTPSTQKPTVPLPAGMEYAQQAYQQQMSDKNGPVPQRIQAYYGELGGQQGTGMSYPDFLASAARLGITVTGNVWGG